MLAKTQTALAKLLASGEPLLIGVSGGADSVALLDALVQLGHRPHVCHLNHGWRGAESDADAEFVRALAGNYGLPVTVEARTSEHTEEAARGTRFDFFADVALRTGSEKLALAHTADDQVETFLLRLLRGAGVPGLIGIWPERQIGPLRVIRPMLKVARAEVLEYLRQRELTYRQDVSNADVGFTRNRIRHELLPLLEREFNPAIRDVLLHTTEILRDEDFYLLHHVAQRFYLAVCRKDAVNVKALANCPVAVQRRLLRFWLGGEDETGPPRFTFEHIEAVRALAQGNSPSAQLDLPDDLVVYREYDELKKARRTEIGAVTGQWLLNLEGETAIQELGVRFVVGISSPRQSSVRPPHSKEEEFDADALGNAPFIRGWREGDRFQPLGMSDEKKLQAFFVDEKVPQRNRGRVPLLCAADGRIAWVVGHRIADPFKVMERARRILRIKVESVQG